MSPRKSHPVANSVAVTCKGRVIYPSTQGRPGEREATSGGEAAAASEGTSLLAVTCCLSPVAASLQVAPHDPCLLTAAPWWVPSHITSGSVCATSSVRRSGGGGIVLRRAHESTWLPFCTFSFSQITHSGEAGCQELSYKEAHGARN